ncbi:hypothetical protein ABH922_004191 [Rhodococcus sp. 27YEA15]|uniref:DUF5691 domain-containing protein n=1 Tax=Rhodococcus sp. 27YEA15 TaxID=3156259 RepID=UPI003C7CF311
MSSLLSAALLGTSRTAPAFDSLPPEIRDAVGTLGDDPARTLLAAAALERAYRRGGAVAVTADVPPPAPEDPRPTLPQSSAAHLLSLLAAKATLLDDWFVLALERDFRAPDHLVAELLSHAHKSEQHRESILHIVGERGRWLAARNPEWKKLVRHKNSDVDLWRHGTPQERVQWLRDTRRIDPAAALSELEQSWDSERGEHKVAFVTALSIGSSPADASLLERALDDKRKDVRREAAVLSSRIPSSPLAERMAQRVLSWVRVERKLLRSKLVIQPPEEIDASARRDGIEDRPNPQTDYRVEYVRQAISCAPLALWDSVIGDSRKVLATAVDPDWEPVLHDAWTSAALAQRNSEWALAILHTRGLSTDRRLLRLVPSQELATLLRSGNGDANVLNPDRAAVYEALPGPWPEDITRAVLGQWERAGARRADGGSKAGEFSRHRYAASLRLAENRFPYTAVSLLDKAAERARDPDWQQAFVRTAHAITYRRTLLEELK